MDNKEEIEYIIEMMSKYEKKPILWKQLHNMLNEATQRLRRKQYEDYFSNRI